LRLICTCLCTMFPHHLMANVEMDRAIAQRFWRKSNFLQQGSRHWKSDRKAAACIQKIQSTSPRVFSAVCVLSYFVTYLLTSTHISNLRNKYNSTSLFEILNIIYKITQPTQNLEYL
jgi:hypothetical protein